MRQPEEVSRSGLASLQKEEGTILRIYKDIAGIETVCTGHVVLPEDRLWLSDGVTQTECREILGSDLRWVVETIHRLVQVTLCSFEFDAIASLIFNIGPGAFASSSVLRCLNGGNINAAGEAFLLWCSATVDGVKKPVLLGRRQRERETFLFGRYPVEVDPKEWLDLRASGKDVQVFELTEVEKIALMATVAVSLREESWRLMDEERRLAHADTEPLPPKPGGSS